MTLLEKLRKEGKLVSASELPPVRVIPTGCLSLDFVLGGGFVRGAIHLLSGAHSSGKTSISAAAAVAVTRQGGKALVLDFERSWLRERLESWGLLNDKVDILCVGSLEEGYDAVVAGLDIYDLIVIDSVNAIVAQAELGKSVEERVYAPGVREINALLRRMLPALGGLNSNAPAIIFTSQVREEIGSYGGGRAILGGHMLKHIAHVWIEATKADPLKVDVETPAGKVERVVGLSIRLFSQKNKFAPPFRRAQLRLLIRDYKTVKAPAFDPYFDTFSWGLLTGIIEQSGSYYIVKPLGLRLHGKEGIYSLDAEKFAAVREAVSKEVQKLMKEW